MQHNQYEFIDTILEELRYIRKDITEDDIETAVFDDIQRSTRYEEELAEAEIDAELGMADTYAEIHL